MQTSSLARDYANIFYEVCVEDNIVDEILYEAKQIQKIHVDNVREILLIPIISKEIKRDIIKSLEEVGFKKELINLLQILLDSDHLGYFSEIIDAFKDIYQEKNNILLVNITSASTLNSSTIDTIRQSLEQSLQKFVVILPSVDENIIGGVKIEYDGKIIDNTIVTQLKKLKELKVS